jgi:hypothetical protein
MLFFLGLLLPVCFISGWTGVSIPTQWAVLSCLLPLSLWRTGRMSVFHWLGVAFLTYAFARAFWPLVPYDTVFALWVITLWALSFWFGSTLGSLSSLFRGLALGLTVSTAVAIGQAFGLHPVLTMPENLAGLLFNQTVQASMIALTIIGLVCYGHWLYIPALLPGLYLAHSRGGWLVLVVGLLARYANLWVIAALASALAIYYTTFLDLSDNYRLQTWAITAKNITLWGYGPGSFNALLFWVKGIQIRPEFAHNDYLQLAFEYGVGAIPLLAIFALSLTQRHVREYPVFIGFLALATFYFPLHHIFVAFVGAMCAGRIARDADFSWLALRLWGPPIIPGSLQARLHIDRNRSATLPL